jgi:NitT/TauT family transport system ATP-binding protein
VKIALRGVRKSFPTSDGATDALAGVDLDVREGEFLAVVGPSGCGKSTLLHCMAGFDTITAGDLRIDGQPVHGPSKRRVFVFQEPGIFPWLTVAENVGFGLWDRPADRDAQVARYIAMVGLRGFEAARPHELSGGMRQRVEFARALAVDPDVLFLDEPFGALDAFTRLEMRREIVRIWQSTGKTVVLVTHDVEEAIELSDRIAVMSARPAIIREVLDDPLPRPRDPDDADFRALKARIYDILGVVRSV